MGRGFVKERDFWEYVKINQNLRKYRSVVRFTDKEWLLNFFLTRKDTAEDYIDFFLFLVECAINYIFEEKNKNNKKKWFLVAELCEKLNIKPKRIKYLLTQLEKREFVYLKKNIPQGKQKQKQIYIMVNENKINVLREVYMDLLDQSEVLIKRKELMIKNGGVLCDKP